MSISTSVARPDTGQALFCFVLAFVGGFNVMVLEMCAFRVLPNTFGSSVYVTGILLSLIMIALSLGYYTGGFFSARSASLTHLLASILAAVVYVQLTSVMLDERILDFTFSLYRKQSSPLVAIGLSTFILYFPPMLALSQVTPFLLNHLSRHTTLAVGPTAGKLMAVSTIGSIVGTLAPTFVLIPSLGVRQTTLVFEASLSLVAIAGFFVVKRARTAVIAVVVVAAVLGSTGLFRDPQRSQRIVYESESLYGNIKVVGKVDQFGERLTYVPNRVYEHSTVYPATPMKNSPVAIDYLTFLTLAPGKRVLVLGTALGTALAMAQHIDPSLEITGVEIDPEIIEVSKKALEELRRPNVKFAAEDARVFLKRDEGTYDFVLVDLFAGNFLPPHCVTQEFFALVLARLSPDGVMFINSNMPEHLALEETPGIERPIRNLQSAIFNAGFAQLLRADFVFNGHMTAFRKPLPLSEHRERLRAEARRNELPVEYRAQLALESFSVSEVSPSRREYPPFTDDWVPDNRIALRENTEGHLEAAARAGAKELGHTSALELAQWRLWEIGRTPGASFSEFIRSSGQGRFCSEINAWASSSTEPVSEMFRYFNRYDIRQCASTAALLPAEPADSRVGAFRGLMLAAALVQEGKADEAWPQLALAIEQPALR